ncbi:hypothetical protein [Roseovarius lutimaris]|uniref:hypothetical protein n=1 Tax=Roseovarius lutimaris TaxID=1005928 RepID=UPI000B81A78D|nr:hypothetical protein [Roseovarius lutimaris]
MLATNTTGLNPNAAMTPDRFVEAIVANLVTRDWRGISPRDPKTRQALSNVVDLLDEAIAEFEENQVKWSELVQWVRTANRVRPSSLGGVEGWEHQLRSAQGYWTKINNPSYEVVDFAISKTSAANELAKLSEDQKKLINKAVDVFLLSHSEAS